MDDAAIEISSRFCGPPQSGNGGYVGGRLAERVATTAAEPAVAVRLFAPPPLLRSLRVVENGESTGLYDGDALVARARAMALDLEAPSAPGFEAAREAAKAFRGFGEHVFPGCFVCGPDRAEGDGLRIFPGPANGDGLFAAPWTPDESLRTAGGDALALPFVWAALDCPGAFSFPQPEGRVVLLGEMQVRSSGSVSIGEPCVLTSWEIARDGRKHHTGSALHGEDGSCRAVARAVWIEVDPASVPGD